MELIIRLLRCRRLKNLQTASANLMPYLFRLQSEIDRLISSADFSLSSSAVNLRRNEFVTLCLRQWIYDNGRPNALQSCQSNPNLCLNIRFAQLRDLRPGPLVELSPLGSSQQQPSFNKVTRGKTNSRQVRSGKMRSRRAKYVWLRRVR